jgi:hypothetical protein
MSQSKRTREYLVAKQVSWGGQSADVDIRDITALGIDENTLAYTSQGGIIDATQGTQTLASQGFGKCTALILRGTVKGNWALAHARPFDERLYYEIESRTGRIAEALFVFGSVSTHQYDLDELLTRRGAVVHSLHAETGDAHFGVALDVPSKKLTVVRKTPDQSLMMYEPFEAR